jgi:hypothetical protein
VASLSSPERITLCQKWSAHAIRRIDDGGVEAIESKRKLVLQFELAGHTPLVWSSSNEQGWDASPFNPWLAHGQREGDLSSRG